MNEQQRIELGSVWQEVDPRFTRVLRVHAVSFGETHHALGAAPLKPGHVTLITVSPETLEPQQGSHYTFAKPDRFNGKRSGYRLLVQP